MPLILDLRRWSASLIFCGTSGAARTLAYGVYDLSYLHVYPLPCLRLTFAENPWNFRQKSEADWHTFWSIRSFRIPHQVCEFSFLTWRSRMPQFVK